MMSARELELPKYNSKHNVQGETTIYNSQGQVSCRKPRVHITKSTCVGAGAIKFYQTRKTRRENVGTR
jgi:hypothetical protein